MDCGGAAGLEIRLSLWLRILRETVKTLELSKRAACKIAGAVTFRLDLCDPDERHEQTRGCPDHRLETCVNAIEDRPFVSRTCDQRPICVGLPANTPRRGESMAQRLYIHTVNVTSQTTPRPALA